MNFFKRAEARFYRREYVRLAELDASGGIPVESIPEPLNSLLIFKPDELGDAVSALPALFELKKARPGTKLYLICQEGLRSFYEKTGLFDEIVGVKIKIHLLRFRSFDLNEVLRLFSVKDFDAAVYLRTYPSPFRVFKKIPARVLIHPYDPRLKSSSKYKSWVSRWGSSSAHQSIQMRQILQPCLPNKVTRTFAPFPKFRWDADDTRALELVFRGNPPEKFFVVHPFSNEETRRYPIESWKLLFEKLSSLNIPGVIIGGKEDPKLESFPRLLQVQGELSLTQSAYLISRAKFFVGVASGPAHVSGALGVPTVVVAGGHHTGAEWSPAGRTLFLGSGVWCAPCYRRYCPNDLICMKELTPEIIFNRLKAFLATVEAGEIHSPEPEVLSLVPRSKREYLSENSFDRIS